MVETKRGSLRRGGELEALALIAGLVPAAPAGEVWMGDDAAVVRAAGATLLLTTDTSVEGVHADLGLTSLGDLGWRAVATAVSDIAAMAGEADHVLVSVAAPPSTDIALLYSGISEAASHHGVPVVGGDLSTAPAIVVTVTVVGHVAEGRRAILRSGAAPGDAIAVTGELGAAAAGLRVLRERGASKIPRDEARLVRAHARPVALLGPGLVAESLGVTAMIDVSDGLATDLRHVASASRVGARLNDVPVAPGATELEALCGGDDYELLMVTPDPGGLVTGFELAGLPAPLLIGECTADQGELTLRGEDLDRCGWEHPWVIPSAAEGTP